jgi:hypothetical protein
MENHPMPRSTRSTTLAALALALLPSIATAQGVRHTHSPFEGKRVPVRPVSVAKEILAHEKDMALTESQRIQLVAIQRQLDSANKPLLQRLDSIRPTWRPAGGLDDLSPEQLEQLVAYRDAEIAIVDSLVPQVTRANERVHALLNEEQRDRSAKLEKDARKRAEKVAKREFESRPQLGERERERQRGEMRNGTGSPPLG